MMRPLKDIGNGAKKTAPLEQSRSVCRSFKLRSENALLGSNHSFRMGDHTPRTGAPPEGRPVAGAGLSPCGSNERLTLREKRIALPPRSSHRVGRA